MRARSTDELPVKPARTDEPKPVPARGAASPSHWLRRHAVDPGALQMLCNGGPGDGTSGDRVESGYGDIVTAARLGTAGPSRALPHLPEIQKSFGKHDVSTVAAHTDASAASGARALGALAFTTGNHVAFAEPPTLRTAAHEAAHVVQQRAGIEIAGGMGRPGDRFERHADAVADRVATGRSSEDLLDAIGSERGVASQAPDPAAPVQRRPRRNATGDHHVLVTVRYIDDSTELGHRLVDRISKETGIPEAALFQPMFTGASERISLALATSHAVKPGGTVRITVDVTYDPERSPVATIDRIAPAIAPPAAAKPSPSPSSVIDDAEQPKAGETVEARLRRQARTVVRTMSDIVAAADREGYAAIAIAIEHNGSELLPGFRKEGPAGRRPPGTQISAAEVAREHLEPELEMILMGGAGKYEIEFGRAENGRFGFLRFRRVPPAPPALPGRTDDLDIPDRKKIYAEIFRKAEQEIKEAGIMVAGFALEQLIWWVAGGILLRALGLIGSGVVRGFPYLRRAIALKRTTNIARAIATLSEAETAEFGRLMQAFEKGTLSAAERTQLEGLMTRVEAALGADVPSLRLVGRIKDNPNLVREAENLSEAAQREVDDLIERYLAGNKNPGTHNRNLEGNIRYLRGRNGGRVFFRETADGYMEVLGKSDKANEDRVIRLVLDTFR